jgi:S1-C subfamily serine protease
LKAVVVAASVLIVTAVTGCGGGAKPADPVELVKRVARGVVEIRDASDAYGTGFVIDKHRGFVLTAAHVVAGLDEVKVRFRNQIVSAEVYGENPCSDLALLKVDALPPQTEPLSFGNSAIIEAGQPITTFGFPITLQNDSRNEKLIANFGSLTADGTVEATPDPSSPKYASVIQHQAPTTQGNSGGPVVDSSGRVIGMEVFHNPDATSQGYAVSSNYIKRALPKLEHGKFVAYIGIFVEPPRYRTREDVRDMDWKIKTPKKGVAVYTLDPGSPADRHNFYYGDYIHDINHKVINSMTDLCDILESHEGQVITISGKEVDTGRGYSEPLRVR